PGRVEHHRRRRLRVRRGVQLPSGRLALLPLHLLLPARSFPDRRCPVGIPAACPGRVRALRVLALHPPGARLQRTGGLSDPALHRLPQPRCAAGPGRGQPCPQARLGKGAVTDRPLDFDALILTGGRGRRLGGRDKAALQVAGTPLLQRALAACRGAQRVIVAGQPPVPPGVHQVQEDPPSGGPVAGIVAGLARVCAPWTLVLAVDQPAAARAVPGPLAAAVSDKRADGGAVRAGSDAAGAAGGTRPAASGMQRGASAQAPPGAGASAEASPGAGASAEAPGPADEADLFCHVDSSGYPQWLLGLYRTASL